jgi:hypothetical protein
MPLTFADFWLVFPRRKGSNPKVLARTKWDKALRLGAEPERIINSARAYREELESDGKVGSEFVCQASTWLNQQRYEDYAPDPGSIERNAKIDSDMLKRGYKWNGTKWEKSDDSHPAT